MHVFGYVKGCIRSPKECDCRFFVKKIVCTCHMQMNVVSFKVVTYFGDAASLKNDLEFLLGFSVE